MSTNKLGDGTVNVGVNMTLEMRAKLRRLAKGSGMSLSKYCRSVLENAAGRNVILEQRVIESGAPEPVSTQSKRSAA
tara:strand:+ start:289 stop:519 length:231 start_codon:yes stop_codon:yes gene_type:complete